MNTFKIHTVWIFFGAVILIPLTAFALFRWYGDRIAPLPYFGAGYTLEDADGPHFSVPPFAFVNEDAQPLDQSVVKDRIWVANYFFITCPSVCPKMMANMQTVQTAFSDDDKVRIISLTVDPEQDTPDRLKAYAVKRRIDLRQWQLATGDKKALYRFARKGLGIAATDGDGGPNDLIHSDRFVLVDQEGHIRGYYDGTSPAEVSQLVRDIRRLEE